MKTPGKWLRRDGGGEVNKEKKDNDSALGKHYKRGNIVTSSA